jgi:hypothetical protein
MISRGIEKWKKLEEEAREIRRSEADWSCLILFILIFLNYSQN